MALKCNRSINQSPPCRFAGEEKSTKYAKGRRNTYHIDQELEYVVGGDEVEACKQVTVQVGLAAAVYGGGGWAGGWVVGG